MVTELGLHSLVVGLAAVGAAGLEGAESPQA